MHGIVSGNAFSTLMLLVGQQEWYLVWYWLIRVVLEKGPLNVCVCACACVHASGNVCSGLLMFAV